MRYLTRHRSGLSRKDIFLNWYDIFGKEGTIDNLILKKYFEITKVDEISLISAEFYRNLIFFTLCKKYRQRHVNKISD